MRIKKAIIGIVTGIVNGLFGSGGGTIAVPAFERLLNMPTHKSHATVIALILPLSALSAVIYCREVDIEWMNVIAVSAGGVVGGYIGAAVLKKISSKWLNKTFGVFMIIAAVRMIL